MKLETYLLVSENSVVRNFDTITDACDFIRNVTISHCVSEIPRVVNSVESLSDILSSEEITSKLIEVLPHYTIRQMINIKGYETSDQANL